MRSTELLCVSQEGTSHTYEASTSARQESQGRKIRLFGVSLGPESLGSGVSSQDIPHGVNHSHAPSAVSDSACSGASTQVLSLLPALLQPQEGHPERTTLTGHPCISQRMVRQSGSPDCAAILDTATQNLRA